MSDRKRIIEALLFASQEPLPVSKIQSVLEVEDRRSILQDLEALREEYEALDRAFRIVEVAGGFQFRTQPEVSPWVKRLRRQAASRLTQASMETMAIIAYKQPVTRTEVEHIRGVDSGAVMRGLLEKGLLKILGRKDVPGRPLLYGTSKKFLEVFSLKDLSSLPDLRDVEELKESWLTENSEDPSLTEDVGEEGTGT
jgi:segregation and condensation protein B